MSDDRAISWPWVLAGMALIMIPGLFGMTIWRVAQTPGVGPLLSQPSPSITSPADGTVTVAATRTSALPTAFPIFASPSAASTAQTTSEPQQSTAAASTAGAVATQPGQPSATSSGPSAIGPTSGAPSATAPTTGGSNTSPAPTSPVVGPPTAISGDIYAAWPGRVSDEEGAYLRVSPDSRAPIRAKPNYGSPLVVLREVQGPAPSSGVSTIWYEVRILPSGETGFIHSSLVGWDPAAGAKEDTTVPSGGGKS